MSHLTCDDIRQTLKQGATLLDVRNSTEFNNSCLPNAKNIPLATLPALADKQLKKHNPVLIYCQSGGRAIIAEKILSGLGFTNITNIGGIQPYQHCH